MDNLPSDNNNSTTLDKGVIHIIDDEQDIVTIATRALEKEGYPVHSFSDTNKALADIEQECRKKVRMLITDIRMPEMTGIRLARYVQEIKPSMKVVIMTAYEVAPEDLSEHLPSITHQDILQKPFKLLQICTTVKKQLQTAIPRK